MVVSDPICDYLLARVRGQGFDVMVLPPRSPAVQGEAWYIGHRRCINIHGLHRSPEWARVLMHEVGHHVTWGRDGGSVFQPTWRYEYQAELFALHELAAYYDEPTMYRLEQQSKDYLRPAIQRMLDADIWTHGEVDAGMWAGCRIPENLMPHAFDRG